MKRLLAILVLASQAVVAQRPADAPAAASVPLKTTFVTLGQGANAVLVEPETTNEKSRIAVLITHPERANNLNYFIGMELPKYGYRAMMLNYYGKEQTYYEFLQPLAAAIKALRAIPGVEKVVLAGHSSGGAELSSYQDVAENGPAACQGADRVYPCDGKNLENLPKADGFMALDSNVGAQEKTISLNPAMIPGHPSERNPDLDMYDPRNGFDPKTNSAHYSPEFLNKFFTAQGARANQLIDTGLDRLRKIQDGKGDYKDDEPFIVPGSSLAMNGARPQLADLQLMSRTHAPHMLLKADGTRPVVIIPVVMPTEATPKQEDTLMQTTMETTVRHYLSFQAVRVTPGFRATADNVLGIQWRSSANSLVGNVEGIKVPTLFMAATCAEEVVFLDIAYDHSVAKDKTFVGVEGANHNFRPCKPEYGDTYKRAFDYVDSWLTTPGRFLP